MSKQRKRHLIQVRVSLPDARMIRLAAQAENVSMAELIRRAVAERVDRSVVPEERHA